jgi:hypothetical protein
MTIEYSSSRREIAAWYCYSLRHSWPHQRRWLLSLLLTGFFIFLLQRQSGASAFGAIGVAVSALAVLVAFFALCPQLRFKPQTRTLQVGPDGMHTTIAARSRSYPWSAVMAIHSVGDFVYIGLKNGNAFVVPERAFASPVQRDQFVAECQRFFRGTQGGAAA